jgi:hypothetical protein
MALKQIFKNMNISMFYELGSTFKKAPVCVKSTEIDWDISCEVLVGNYSNISLPVTFHQISGKTWTDFLTPTGAFRVVSKKFISLLIEHNITGWKTFDIKIFDNQNKEIFDYCGLSVVGKSGEIDYSKCETYSNQLVPNGTINTVYRGMYFKNNEWDGSDIFMPKNTLFTIISQRVQEIILKNKISNIILTKLSDYETLDIALPKDK